MARGAVDQGDAVQEKARRDRSQQEVLHRRFGTARTAPIHASQHINRERHQFNTEENEHQIACSREHHHAGGSEQHQHWNLGTKRRTAVVLSVQQDERQHRAE